MEVLRGTKSAIDIIKMREDPFVVRNEITSTSFYFRHNSDFFNHFDFSLNTYITVLIAFILQERLRAKSKLDIKTAL